MIWFQSVENEKKKKKKKKNVLLFCIGREIGSQVFYRRVGNKEEL